MSQVTTIHHLPTEVLAHCFNSADINLQVGMLVCKGWKSAIQTTALQSLWKELTTNLPEGPIDLKKIVTKIQRKQQNSPEEIATQQNSPPNYLPLFKHLHNHIKTTYGYSFAPRATCTDLKKLQKIEDDCLWKIWQKIQLKIQVANPPQNADEARAFLNNPQNAAILNTITNLGLFNLGLEVLPPEICKLTQLRELDLGGNKLTALPESFGNFTQLQWLDLHGNKLTVLPESFGNLPQLQTLDLHNNKLTALPESFGKLTLLQTLYLNCNKLTALPESFGNLTQLQRIHLPGNQLTVLPESFGKLTQLRELYLDGNQLTVLPEFVGNFTQLKWLDLDGNKLTALPESFRNLTQLLMLHIGGNKLTALPESFRNLTQLQQLFLYGNRWMFIPDTVRKQFAANPDIECFVTQLAYNCQTPLATLYKAIICQQGEQEIQQIFQQTLTLADQHLIYEMVWMLSGKPLGDPQWGEHHVFDDMQIFYRAVQEAIFVKLKRMPTEQANLVYGQVYALAGRPATTDREWGEHHAHEHPARLADALALSSGT